MRRVNHEKSKFIGTILLLLMFCIGIGYAALTEQISVDQAINFGTMKWDVGFISAADKNGSATSIPTISQDKKTINVNCNLAMTTEPQTCIITATIKNSGTFNVELESEPITEYDSEFIESITVKYQAYDSEMNPMEVGDALFASQEESIIIRVTTKKLTKEMIDKLNETLSVKIKLNWVERPLKEIITFQLYNQTYQAEKDMTLEEWIHSTYNSTNQLKLFNFRNCTGTIMNDAGFQNKNTVTGKYAECSDIIVNGDKFLGVKP